MPLAHGTAVFDAVLVIDRQRLPLEGPVLLDAVLGTSHDGKTGKALGTGEFGVAGDEGFHGLDFRLAGLMALAELDAFAETVSIRHNGNEGELVALVVVLGSGGNVDSDINAVSTAGNQSGNNIDVNQSGVSFGVFLTLSGKSVLENFNDGLVELFGNITNLFHGFRVLNVKQKKYVRG